MIYKLTNKELVQATHSYVDMEYETEADSLEEAVEKLHEHIFNMTKEEIGRALTAN